MRQSMTQSAESMRCRVDAIQREDSLSAKRRATSISFSAPCGTWMPRWKTIAESSHRSNALSSFRLEAMVVPGANQVVVVVSWCGGIYWWWCLSEGCLRFCI